MAQAENKKIKELNLTNEDLVKSGFELQNMVLELKQQLSKIKIQTSEDIIKIIAEFELTYYDKNVKSFVMPYDLVEFISKIKKHLEDK